MSEAVIVRDYDSLVAAFRARKDELGLSNNLCDHLLNRQAGFTDHYLGRADKNLGPVTITVFCELLAIEFVPKPNDRALERMQALYEQRTDAQVRAHTKPLSIWQIMGRAGGVARSKKLNEKTRKRIATKAIKTRWKRQRVAKSAANVAKATN